MRVDIPSNGFRQLYLNQIYHRIELERPVKLPKSLVHPGGSAYLPEHEIDQYLKYVQLRSGSFYARVFAGRQIDVYA